MNGLDQEDEAKCKVLAAPPLVLNVAIHAHMIDHGRPDRDQRRHEHGLLKYLVTRQRPDVDAG